MNNVKLIKLVEGYKGLYDINEENYADSHWRDNVWNEIGEALKKSPLDCKNRWKGIRDNYRKWLKLSSVHEYNSPFLKRYRYASHLEFLDVIIKRSKDSNLENENKSKSDHIDTFLSAIGITMKKFPPFYQNVVKSNIFTMVQHMEMEILMQGVRQPNQPISMNTSMFPLLNSHNNGRSWTTPNDLGYSIQAQQQSYSLNRNNNRSYNDMPSTSYQSQPTQ